MRHAFESRGLPATGITLGSRPWPFLGARRRRRNIKGALLGLPISGIPIPALLRAQVTGPELWTGGRFGPEASLPMAAFVLLAAAFYVRRAAVDGRLVRGTWLAFLGRPPAPARSQA